ncbi:MAG: translation initiation factor IF-3 [Phycisphaeraceae bacterium]
MELHGSTISRPNAFALGNPDKRRWRARRDGPVNHAPPFAVRIRLGEPIIARGRFRPPPRETGKSLRTNDAIRAPQVRLIDENEEQVGVVDVQDAKRRARDAQLDLVEVSPTAKPPVCKIMDYGKWKYAQKKKEAKAKAHAKQSELKGMRLRPNIDEHDLNIKVNKAREFLEDGDKCQFTMLFRGRQMAHQGLALSNMRKIAASLEDIAQVEQQPRMQGRRATMVLAPGKAKKKEGEKGEKKAGEQRNAGATQPQQDTAEASSS